MKVRLDHALVQRKLIESRSQAGSVIRLGEVKVNDRVVTKPGHFVSDTDDVMLKSAERYVSRAGLKLASVAEKLKINLNGKTVLDVGSSTGGFTDYALRRGATGVIAVDVGTDQLHPSLLTDDRIELHEKTDIRDFSTDRTIDVVVGDVSFISLREILPSVARIAPKALIAMMVKPQFEAERGQVNKGVIKNDSIRRQILKDFEAWAKIGFVILDKADSDIAGAKGNRERFYLLKTNK